MYSLHRRALRTADPLAVAPPTNRRKDRPNRPNGLTKQTYSALVYLPGSSLPRKWHVVAYFTVSLVSTIQEDLLFITATGG